MYHRLRSTEWLALLAVGRVIAWSQPDTRIVPLYTVSPAVFQTGLASNVQLYVLNANPNSTQQIQTADTFTFTLNITGGSIVNLGPITSVGCTPSSFSTSLSADGKQITLVYNGPPAIFGPGASSGSRHP